MSLCPSFRAREFAPTEDEKWVTEFEEQMKSGDGLQSVARDMSQSVTDPDIQATEVHMFVHLHSTCICSLVPRPSLLDAKII